jgi:hypothetical protein
MAEATRGSELRSVSAKEVPSRLIYEVCRVSMVVLIAAVDI